MNKLGPAMATEMYGSVPFTWRMSEYGLCPQNTVNLFFCKEIDVFHETKESICSAQNSYATALHSVTARSSLRSVEILRSKPTHARRRTAMQAGRREPSHTCCTKMANLQSFSMQAAKNHGVLAPPEDMCTPPCTAPCSPFVPCRVQLTSQPRKAQNVECTLPYRRGQPLSTATVCGS